MRLLYVEDDRINALLFEAAMQSRADDELQVVEDGRQALETARQWMPDVLIIDAHLPDMSGFHLLQALHTLPGLARVPAFMCSADDAPEDLARARDAGFQGYWSKPINLTRVMADLDALRAADTPTC